MKRLLCENTVILVPQRCQFLQVIYFRFFKTIFEVFENQMKHSSECTIQRFKLQSTLALRTPPHHGHLDIKDSTVVQSPTKLDYRRLNEIKSRYTDFRH